MTGYFVTTAILAGSHIPVYFVTTAILTAHPATLAGPIPLVTL